MFGITAQLRRAALWVPTNIVEGYNRKSNKEFAHFIDISLASQAETEYLIEFAVELNYIKKDAENIRTTIEDVGNLL